MLADENQFEAAGHMADDNLLEGEADASDRIADSGPEGEVEYVDLAVETSLLGEQQMQVDNRV